MKVVQINAVYQFSSTGRSTQEMHLAFLKKGIESYVFCTNYADAFNNIYKIGNAWDHKVHALFSRIWGKQGYYSKSSNRALLTYLGQIMPDLVILRNLHANYANISILLKYLADNDIATIIVLHDCWFFTGHCCHYTEDKCYKWETECDHCPILHKYNASLFFDRSNWIFKDKKRLFSQIRRLGVVGVSDWITNEARRSFLKDAKVIRRIYNWIDLDVFKPQKTEELRNKWELSKDQFLLLGVAQGWSNAKGLHIFLEIAQRYPDIKVILVGEMVDGRELPQNVIAVGILSDVHQLATYYSVADVFLNPSIQETFGKVSAEALACGTPVIVNNATANPEIAGDCGFVVHDNDIQEICTAIDQIQKVGKPFYAAKCVRRAAELFNRGKNIEEYLQVYQDLLDKENE